MPGLAAHHHLETLHTLTERSLKKAGLQATDIDVIGVTAGPGLIGGVMVGYTFAQGIFFGLGGGGPNAPLFYPINHLEGHALMPRFTHAVPFPYLLLLMSGGHTQWILVRGLGRYETLGTTLDDALGETFDKTARLLGLPYPGGAPLEKLATQGNPLAYTYPKPLWRRVGCDFSFSGLKTAVREQIENQDLTSEKVRSDIAASFQYTVGETLKDRLRNVQAMVKTREPGCKYLVLSGGVAANRYLLETLTKAAGDRYTVVAPPPHLCTDNGLMIAYAALERLRDGRSSNLHFVPRPRWPLEEVT
jgi:N6-L-threonylcarbamoyladenine synthase